MIFLRPVGLPLVQFKMSLVLPGVALSPVNIHSFLENGFIILSLIMLYHLHPLIRMWVVMGVVEGQVSIGVVRDIGENTL